jgi:hypothetical protein
VATMALIGRGATAPSRAAVDVDALAPEAA